MFQSEPDLDSNPTEHENRHYDHFVEIITNINTELETKLSATPFVAQLAELWHEILKVAGSISSRGPRIAFIYNRSPLGLKCMISIPTVKIYFHQI